MNTPHHLLDHLVNMTSLRDVDLLEVSLLKTIHRTAHLDGLTLYKVINTSTILTEISYIADRCAIKHSGIELDPKIQAAFSQLANQNLDEVRLQHNGQVSTVFCASENRRMGTYLVVHSKGPLSRAMVQTVSTMLLFYKNFCELLQDSQTDPLTGLYNRKTFDDAFYRFQRAQHSHQLSDVTVERRAQKDLLPWLAMVDIDHFKKINDTYGHLYGDEILILLAQQFKASLRSDDQVFRFGGEEFILIVHCLNAEEAKLAMERLRQAIQDMHVPQVGHVTVSIGLAHITPDTFSGTILDYADKALYHSKNNGRNRVTLFEDLVQQGLEQAEPPPEDSIDYF